MGVALVALVAGMIVLGEGRPEGVPVIVDVPQGAALPQVARILEQHEVVRSASLFHLYARLRRADRKLKAGVYEMETATSMRSALSRLTTGDVETVAFTIPEGFTLKQMSDRIAAVSETPPAQVLMILEGKSAAAMYDVPGPTLEGYLFPDTYRFARGVSVESVVEAMVARYHAVWTPERRDRLASSGMSEREVVALASIIQAEARHVDEMPRIAGVYHNRLEAGWLLQADPTVLYALGGYRARLLYAAIDSVEGHPYNTYSQVGLPPGPIGSPGEQAIDAALSPESHEFMYFVAWPDGTHVFTNTLAQHNAAKENARRAREGA
jgi:UPF0755 protein